jgi:hypothetical protein
VFDTVRQFLAVIGLSVVAAVVYGIAHDLVTAHVCVEYFTIGHPPVFATSDPIELAIGWGIIATWWVGAGLGIVLALAAQAGSRERRTAQSLVRPLVKLSAIAGVCALAAGTAGYFLAHAQKLTLVGPIVDALPADRRVAYIADACAHLASYGVGFIGGLILSIQVWRSRRVTVGPTAGAS